MVLTIAEYFDRLATQGLGIEISEEFDNAIVDTLEIIANHPIGDFENEEEEFLDKPAWEEEEDV